MDEDKYIDEAPEHRPVGDLTQLPDDDIAVLLKSGIDPKASERSGSFFQMDHSVAHCKTNFEGAEIMSTPDALKKYDWLKDYWWRALSPDKDEYTKRAQIHQENGYFIRAFAGARVTYPLQACLYITVDKLAQDVHNVIIAEEGSYLHVITGCATGPKVKSGLHVGISEFYVKKGATLIFTMIHNWPDEMKVRPRTAIVVEEGAKYISNYICLLPAKDLQAYPVATLVGENAVATFNSVLLGKPGSFMDLGSRVILKAKNTRAEIVSRTVSTGGTIIARGHLVGEAQNIKAHLECKGLILSDIGKIHAIPELEAKVSGVDMSHEAAVGKIARDEIEYLMARGLSEREAVSLIIKGFLSLEVEGLPFALKMELDRLIDEVDKSAF